jgi:hypothetical protein
MRRGIVAQFELFLVTYIVLLTWYKQLKVTVSVNKQAISLNSRNVGSVDKGRKEEGW